MQKVHIDPSISIQQKRVLQEKLHMVFFYLAYRGFYYIVVALTFYQRLRVEVYSITHMQCNSALAGKVEKVLVCDQLRIRNYLLSKQNKKLDHLILILNNV